AFLLVRLDRKRDGAQALGMGLRLGDRVVGQRGAGSVGTAPARLAPARPSGLSGSGDGEPRELRAARVLRAGQAVVRLLVPQSLDGLEGGALSRRAESA